jgi:hypothetical protein
MLGIGDIPDCDKGEAKCNVSAYHAREAAIQAANAMSDGGIKDEPLLLHSYWLLHNRFPQALRPEARGRVK